MHRVLVYAPPGVEWAGVCPSLRDQGFELQCIQDGQALVEQVMSRRPDALLYGLRAAADHDLGLLQLLRRIVRELPLVLVAEEGSLLTQKLVQDLRPIYYAVCPVDAAELLEAVQAALAHRGRHRAGV